MFDRAELGETVVLVHIHFKRRLAAADLEEFSLLASAAGCHAVATITGTRDAPDPKFFVGEGKLDEIHQIVQAEDAAVVIFNHELSPSQERNIEKELCCRVLSRTGLILDIFAARAQTFEGKLQVELAQLEHLATRLVRGWTHLERQKGGIGMRGPGESQLETDRRLLRIRIDNIKRRLEKVRSTRELGRKARSRQPLATVSLVGYTNAGKSTLFNALTGSNVFVADQLFATLDPTLRTIELPVIGKCILADTVGFIQALPTALVDAFRSTLEETTGADLLLHVVDVNAENRKHIISEVNKTLTEIGADAVPQLMVFNKIDAGDIPSQIQRNDEGIVEQVWVSALTGEGLEQLNEAIVERLSIDILSGTLKLKPDEQHLRAVLFQAGVIIHETIEDDGSYQLECQMPKVIWGQLSSRYPAMQDNWVVRPIR